MAFFQNSVVKKYLQNQDKPKVVSQWNVFRNHFLNSRIQDNIRNSKEEEYQGEFLIDLFVNVLGYTKKPQENYNLVTEKKNTTNSEKSDGAIIINDKVKAVIELKGTKLTDLKKIEVQAFGYKNNHPECVFVITSNFEKLRFYINNATEYLEFNLFQLTEIEFELLYLVLSYDSLSKGLANTIKEESIIEEKKISNELYKDYSTFKSALHQNLVLLNPEYNPLELLKKSQKLLDRFLFIFFAEDKNLVPTNLIFRINKEWQQLVNMRINQSLYDRYKIYFEDLNSGALVTLPAFSKTVSDTKEKHQLFAYNGGLFQPDEVLNNIRIDDQLLFDYTEKLSEYDFESEIDVNILGHIFENSLNDFDEVKAKIEGKKIDTSKTKRKKDGVFYTPKYITKYMVDNSLGLLCNEKKKLLKINDENYQPAAKRSRERLNNLNEYRKWLKQLAICDPACGSGAFLNQAFDFLIEEHKYIDELSAKYNKDTFILSDVEKSILENNLFGVDLNDESVEIAKLSLWLRTAKPNRKLNDLNNNIKCGNSLIDDKNIAGDKAFDWRNEFPQIFAKGGFDVIIGNPPYGIFIDKEMQDYFKTKFPLTQYKTNLYVLFVERMLQVFEKGIVFFIIPKSLLFNSYYELIRKELILKTELNEIFTITERVFEDAEVGSSLLIKFTIKDNLNKKNIVRLASAEKIKNFISGNGIVENKIEQNSFLKIPNVEISVVSSDSQSIVKKLNQMKTIDNYYTLRNGLNPGNIKHLLISDKKNTDNHRPIIWGKDISKYNISWSGQFINYDETIINRISIDDIKSKEGMNKQNKIDFALRTPKMFNDRKIIIRKTGDSLICSVDELSYCFDTLAHGIYQNNKNYSLEFLTAILNSNPATIFYRLLHDIKGKVFAKISLDNLSSFPIPSCNSTQRNEIEEASKKLSNLSKVLDEENLKFQRSLERKFGISTLPKALQKWYLLNYTKFINELSKLKIKLTLSQEAEWENYFIAESNKVGTIHSEIESINKTLNKLIYEVYGLTNDEIEVLEK